MKRKFIENDTTENQSQGTVYFQDNIDVADEIVIESSSTKNDTGDDSREEQKFYLNVETQTPTLSPMCIDNFENDDAGIHFYTGLETYVKFCMVLRTLGPAAYCLNYIYHKVTNISVPDQFFLVLSKLRRHRTNFDFSRLFNISEKKQMYSIHGFFFMSKQWREVDIWPPKSLVHNICPSDFKLKCPNTRVIVDGTECPIKKPKLPKTQQATFSTYKNKNTVKILVGATPGGLVSYVSPAYGGSTSDRQIVERSSLLNLCDPGDSIMADKGFNVQDMFVHRNIQINMPTFFKKKNRMSCSTVIQDRKISSKRVHIERIIGLAKTFKILVKPMNSSETKLSSHITFVCFMLCYFKTCIVPSYA